MLRYASEVDVDFVRRSIKAIGQTAIKIDEAAERCVNVLLELINTRVSYVVQEAVVVMKVCESSRSFRILILMQKIGHLPKIPLDIRRCHPDIVCEPRRAG